MSKWIIRSLKRSEKGPLEYHFPITINLTWSNLKKHTNKKNRHNHFSNSATSFNCANCIWLFSWPQPTVLKYVYSKICAISDASFEFVRTSPLENQFLILVLNCLLNNLHNNFLETTDFTILQILRGLYKHEEGQILMILSALMYELYLFLMCFIFKLSDAINNCNVACKCQCQCRCYVTYNWSQQSCIKVD